MVKRDQYLQARLEGARVLNLPVQSLRTDKDGH